jgi:hypothetical protein
MTEGLVLHPGHDDLHGITVVVTGASGRTYVGRWHERQPRGVVMKNAAVLESGAEDVDVWLGRIRKFGVPSQHRVLVVPEEEVGEVRRLV